MIRKEFEAFVNEQRLFSKNDRILLALSGGVDSVVLAELLLELGYTFSAAHCNFHLRAEESNRDADFVIKWAERNGVELFVQDFDTYGYMQEKGISLEMAARELRYSWFENIMQENQFDYLLTAHHADDSAETFFINLLRGTGIAGLHGILPKNGSIVRPLLFATRKSILDYAESRNIQFVEDSTNSETKFLRNKIRHRVIPVLKEISPDFDSVIRKNIERLRDTETIFRSAIEKVKDEIIIREKENIKISIAELQRLHPIGIYLYEILSDYGFNESVVNNVSMVLDAESGKRFYSKTHCLLKDREYLLIYPIEKEEKETDYSIDAEITSIIEPFKAKIEVLKDLNFISVPKKANVAMLDMDLLNFPLELRHWRQGDSFVPFGMKKKKKLSDFFTANKYSLLDKERQWLLCSGNEIVWVVGKRIDDRFKISNSTKSVLKIEINE
ncbi:MAG: tRNA lysidine(34) synthetase TilS [Bacteroidales bacterium]|nr:tRNA lysidine(34) synthetase TilS [Bacteroidales bacterium]